MADTFPSYSQFSGHSNKITFCSAREALNKQNWHRVPYFGMVLCDQQLSLFALFASSCPLPTGCSVFSATQEFQLAFPNPQRAFLFFHWTKVSLLRCCIIASLHSCVLQCCALGDAKYMRVALFALLSVQLFVQLSTDSATLCSAVFVLDNSSTAACLFFAGKEEKSPLSDHQV